MAKQKVRSHNEWFQPIKKSKCSCGLTCKSRAALGLDESMYAWGNYVYAKWRTVDHFCQGCFGARVLYRLTSHTANCGCEVKFCARSGHSLPSWIKLEEDVCKVA